MTASPPRPAGLPLGLEVPLECSIMGLVAVSYESPHPEQQEGLSVERLILLMIFVLLLVILAVIESVRRGKLK